MKRILSLDGGGAKGVIQIAALIELEKKTGKKTHELFDLIIGTSVGSINATLLSSGKFTAEDIMGIMKTVLPKVFKRVWFKKGKYSKKELKKAYDSLLGKDYCLKDSLTKTIVTSYEDTEGREHFFKSWEEVDGKINAFDAVDRSSAAPIFFGAVIDEDTKKVWLDGGVGVYNNPSLYAFAEAKIQGWLAKEKVVCYSVGCGSQETSRSFKEATKQGKISQLLNFIDPNDGGLARRNASESTSEFLTVIENSRWDYRRYDILIPKKINGMDKVKYTSEYEKIGKIIGEKLSESYQ
jgi:uncharacterized protein